jgi:hypothetical protein
MTFQWRRQYNYHFRFGRDVMSERRGTVQSRLKKKRDTERNNGNMEVLIRWMQ